MDVVIQESYQRNRTQETLMKNQIREQSAEIKHKEWKTKLSSALIWLSKEIFQGKTTTGQGIQQKQGFWSQEKQSKGRCLMVQKVIPYFSQWLENL